MDITMKCKCFEFESLDGADVWPFVEEHLEVVNIDAEKWQTEYICPVTKTRWLETYSYPESHGGGIPHLRKICSADKK